MMRAATLAALLVPGVLAGGSCRPKPGNGSNGGSNAGGNAGPAAVSSNAPAVASSAFVAHTWTAIAPEAALSSLTALAHASPAAVAVPPGVNLPGIPSGLLSTLTGPTAGRLPTSIPLPSECSTLPIIGTLPGAGTTAAASGTGAAGTSAAASTHGASASGSGYRNSTTTAARTTLSTSTSSSSSSASPTSTTCNSPVARRSWSALSSSEQQQYVAAVQCLLTKASRLSVPQCKNRWDDLVYMHQTEAVAAHGNSNFLPWHAGAVHIFEKEVQACGWSQGVPYWDVAASAGDYTGMNFFASNLFGSAPTSLACVAKGATAGHPMDIGPGYVDTPHCLERKVNNTLSRGGDQSYVNYCSAYTDYSKMCECHFKGLHAFCHDSVGGDMSDVATSPNDPLFWLLHSDIDRIWRGWQSANIKERLYAIDGWATTPCQNSNGGPGCQAATISDVLSYAGMFQDITVGQLMNPENDLLCYYYE